MLEFLSIIFGSSTLARFVLFPLDMDGWSKKVIRDNISFYNCLSDTDKRYFEHRVIKFIEHHNFIGREGVEVTARMKLLIASTAIMLTFGMRQYLFLKFRNIIIYPRNYLSTITKKQHKGETNPKYGTIVFSWNDFMEGIKVEDNNLNLGLHELTHAMHFSFLRHKTLTAIVFLDHFRSLLERLKDKRLQRKIVASGYLRTYAYRNQYEFLSVLVEHYFETPKEFQEKLPEIYNKVKVMLNLDMLEIFAAKPVMVRS
ncbi:MAG: zinc-dependent peptidase [Flavobacteriaceae bacterium]|nr:zinc-dependent peptidase [Flavobacteriaceae bacterium]